MSFETSDFKETLRMLNIQKRLEAWPTIMEEAFADAQDVLAELDALSALPPYPESGTMVQRIKIRGPRTKYDSDAILGSKDDEPYVYCGSSTFLQYLATFDKNRFAAYMQTFRDMYCGKKTDEFRKFFLSQPKAKFPYRLIDPLLQENPLIATALYVRYIAREDTYNEVETKNKETNFEERDWQASLSNFPDAYYSFTVVESELCLEFIDQFFLKLKMGINDELTERFVDDVQRDLSEAIYESIRIFFDMVFKGSERHTRGQKVRTLPDDDLISSSERAAMMGAAPVYFFSRFTFPVSEKEYTTRRGEIEALVKRIIEADPDPFAYSIKGVEPFQHSFEEFTKQDSKASYQLAIPYVLSWLDIQIFLEEYLRFWKGLIDDLDVLTSANVHTKTERTHIDFSDGASILLRKKAVMLDGKKRDARISIKGPGDTNNSIDFRIDRDAFVQSVSLEYGRITIDQVLDLMYEILEAIELKGTPSPSAMDARVLFSSLENTENQGKGGITMSNKLAFFISAVLNNTIRQFEKSGDYGTTYHVRGAIAQEEYFSNFAHIVSQIEAALSGRQSR